MLSEVANTLLLTFYATEYLIATNDGIFSNKTVSKRAEDAIMSAKNILFSLRSIILIGAVAVINLVDHVAGFSEFLNKAASGIFHAPRVVFIAFAYIVALFLDCRRSVGSNVEDFSFLRGYLPNLLKAFLYILPVYPYLAVLLSFLFMILIRAFELVGLPPEKYLNGLVYYGVLYGPFSLVYLRVKREVVEGKSSLPSVFNPRNPGAGF